MTEFFQINTLFSRFIPLKGLIINRTDSEASICWTSAGQFPDMAAKADNIIVYVYILSTWVILDLVCVKVKKITQVTVPPKWRIRSYGHKSRCFKNSSSNSSGQLLRGAILTAAIIIQAFKFIQRKRIRGWIRMSDNGKKAQGSGAWTPTGMLGN